MAPFPDPSRGRPGKWRQIWSGGKQSQSYCQVSKPKFKERVNVYWPFYDDKESNCSPVVGRWGARHSGDIAVVLEVVLWISQARQVFLRFKYSLVSSSKMRFQNFLTAETKQNILVRSCFPSAVLFQRTSNLRGKVSALRLPSIKVALHKPKIYTSHISPLLHYLLIPNKWIIDTTL